MQSWKRLVEMRMMLHRLKSEVRIQLHSYDSDENFIRITFLSINDGLEKLIPLEVILFFCRC